MDSLTVSRVIDKINPFANDRYYAWRPYEHIRETISYPSGPSGPCLSERAYFPGVREKQRLNRRAAAMPSSAVWYDRAQDEAVLNGSQGPKEAIYHKAEYRKRGIPLELYSPPPRPHIRHKDIDGESRIHCTLTRWGDTFRVQKTTIFEGIPGGRRSVIRTFNLQSASRLMEKMGGIDYDAYKPGSLIECTLTYPAETIPSDGREVKAHLKAFLQRLRRKNQGVGVVWKMEFTRKGVPHLHLFLLFAEEQELGTYYVQKDTRRNAYDREKKEAIKRGKRGLRLWIQESWYGIVKSGLEKHFNAGTECEVVRESRRMGNYFAKYIGDCGERKKYQHDVPEWFKGSGRWWGVFNRMAITWLPIETINLTPREEIIMVKVIQGYFKDATGKTYQHPIRRVTLWEENKKLFDWIFENLKKHDIQVLLDGLPPS